MCRSLSNLQSKNALTHARFLIYLKDEKANKSHPTINNVPPIGVTFIQAIVPINAFK